MTSVQTEYRKTSGVFPSTFQTVSAEKHFSGKPCWKCKGTLRYKKGHRNCVACARRRSKIWSEVAGPRKQKTDPEANRRSHLKRAFGITPEQYNEMLDAQGKRCAICRAETHGSKGWHVDHCHASGRVRGILCHGCNLILGHAKDDVARLSACISYLDKQSRCHGA